LVGVGGVEKEKINTLINKREYTHYTKKNS
jgi:hypothetical protein